MFRHLFSGIDHPFWLIALIAVVIVVGIALELLKQHRAKGSSDDLEWTERPHVEQHGAAEGFDAALVALAVSALSTKAEPAPRPKVPCSSYHSRMMGAACTNCGHLKEAHPVAKKTRKARGTKKPPVTKRKAKKKAA